MKKQKINENERIMKVATFNMENIFFRDERLIKKNVSYCLSGWMEEFESLMSKESRIHNKYVRMRELSFLLGFHQSALEPYVVLRRKAGQLYMKRRTGKPEFKASPFTGWNGWIKLCSRPIDEVAIQNKARLITEVNPDVLVVQEVEDRQSLIDFNEHFLPEEVKFSNIYVLGGNDQFGREMGIMAKKGFRIFSSRNYANKTVESGQFLFDQDFQLYEVGKEKEEKIIILSACLKEQDKPNEEADEFRKRQAEKIAQVYEQKKGEGHEQIIVTGTFNSPSFSDSLSPILRATDLQEIKKHKSFNVDLDEGIDAGYFSLGAYRKGVNIKQKDYLLFSPQLFNRLVDSGLNRKGVYPSKQDQYKVYGSVTSEQSQASNHPLLWANFY